MRFVSTIQNLYLLLASLGFVVAYALLREHDQTLALPCFKGSACGELAQGPYSSFLGVSLPVYGMICYGAIIALLLARTFVAANFAKLLSTALHSLVALAAFISLNLQIVSIFYIKIFCIYCFSSALILVSMFVAMICVARLSVPVTQSLNRLWSVAVLVAFFSALFYMSRLSSRSLEFEPSGDVNRLAESNNNQLVPSGAPVFGSRNAKVTVVAFIDLGCSGCRHALSATLDALRHKDSVRIVYRDFPLKQHKFGDKLAVLGKMANERGKFQEYFEMVSALNFPVEDDFFNIMTKIGVPGNVARKRLANHSDPAWMNVSKDLAYGNFLGVNRTPTFILIGKEHQAKYITDGQFSALLEH